MKVLILSCTIVLCCGLVVASPLKDSAINTLKEDNNVAALEAETDSEDVERAKKNIATHLCYPVSIVQVKFQLFIIIKKSN